MNPLLLIGAGGCLLMIDLIETEGVWQIHGLIGLPEQVGTQVLSYPVLGTDDDLPICTHTARQRYWPLDSFRSDTASAACSSAQASRLHLSR